MAGQLAATVSARRVNRKGRGIGMNEKFLELVRLYDDLKRAEGELESEYGVTLCTLDALDKTFHIYNGICDVAKAFGKPLSVKPFIEKEGSSEVFFVADGIKFFSIATPRPIEKLGERDTHQTPAD